MEQNLMTIRDVARYLQMAEQTIQRYVLKKAIPYHKIKKVIRFRFSEVNRWVDSGGLDTSIDGKRELCCPPTADSLGVCSANSSDREAKTLEACE